MELHNSELPFLNYYFLKISLTSDLFRLVFVLFLPKHKTEAMFVCGCGTNKETSYQLVILLFTEFQLIQEWMGWFYARCKTKEASWWKSRRTLSSISFTLCLISFHPHRPASSVLPPPSIPPVGPPPPPDVGLQWSFGRLDLEVESSLFMRSGSVQGAEDFM